MAIEDSTTATGTAPSCGVTRPRSGRDATSPAARYAHSSTVRAVEPYSARNQRVEKTNPNTAAGSAP